MRIHLLLIFFFGLLYTPATLHGQQLDINLSSVMSIGGESFGEGEVMFGWIQDVVVDSAGRIYVADPQSKEIYVLAPDGELLEILGGSGRGPGEFLDLTSMDLTADGRVAATDRKLSRITYFEPSEGDQRVYNFDFSAGFTWDMAALNDSAIALVKTGFEYDNKEQRYIVSIFTHDFSKIIGGYFDADRIDRYGNTEFEKAIQEIPMSYRLESIEDTRLALTHQFYNGSVYVIDLQDPDSTGMATYSGAFADRGKPYLILSYPNRDEGESREVLAERYYGLSSGSHGYTYQVLTKSEALLSNDHYLFHFVRTVEGKESEYFMEIFQTSGEYVGYGSLSPEVQTRDGMRNVFQPLHIDDQNLLYYLDYRSGVPVLQVVKIDFFDSE